MRWLRDLWWEIRLSVGFAVLPGSNKDARVYDGPVCVHVWSDDFDLHEEGE